MNATPSSPIEGNVYNFIAELARVLSSQISTFLLDLTQMPAIPSHLEIDPIVSISAALVTIINTDIGVMEGFPAFMDYLSGYLYPNDLRDLLDLHDDLVGRYENILDLINRFEESLEEIYPQEIREHVVDSTRVSVQSVRANLEIIATRIRRIEGMLTAAAIEVTPFIP